ncbi:MAG: L-type lectin family protein [Aggregatilineales bacterium]
MYTPNSVNHAPSVGATLGITSSLPITLADGNIHKVVVTYTANPGTLNIFQNNYAAPVLTVSVNLATKLTLANGRAWVGFTGSTGSFTEGVAILNWNFKPTPDTIALYNPSLAQFFLRNSNSSGFADTYLVFGYPTDLPMIGDWTGHGVDTVGVYRPSTGQFFVRYTNTTGYADQQFNFGIANTSYQVLVGRWNPTFRHDGVGLYNLSSGVIWLKNDLTSGTYDYQLVVGIPGTQVETIGNWDGDGTTGLGIGFGERWAVPIGRFTRRVELVQARQG